MSELAELLTYYNVIFLLKGMGTTFALSALGCILGGLFGTALAVARLTTGPLTLPLRALALVFTEFFRRVPFLVTLMLCFFIFQFSGLDVSTFTVGCVTVVLIGTAFLAEIVRAGLQSVHSNQWHAAETMNFTLLQTIRYVVLPQAWTVILPPAFGFFILFIKDSALASQIGVIELTYVGKVFNNRGFSAGVSFGVILVAYFMLSYPLSRLGAKLEKKLGSSRTR
ncbi:amino acid ABC transporter permease [Marinovum sp.]|uniref:amino acid ABC transporter permease n=1 Tax=Marinovum sp. TaxID=2024839 RepID=UPI003A8E2426